MRHKKFWTVLLTLALVAQPALVRSAEAATYTVDTTVDENDSSCGDGDCSLRDAMILANSNPGPDTINFDISGCGGVCTIQPTSALPTLTDDGTTIDGYSQPGALQATDSTSATLLIEIDGSGAGTTNGLTIYSAGNEIKGLAINRFSQSGISISGSGATGNVVSGNFIGTDANGTADLGNAWRGVWISGGAQNNTVGGDTAGERNVISGNDYDGALISGSGTTGNVISGNFIGTGASGTAGLGNAFSGVYVTAGAQNNTIGGDTATERNVISGNGFSGVLIGDSGTTSNTISGNTIGTNAAGTADLGNAWDGVYIGYGAQNNTVGGDTAGERNVISGNNQSGVSISGSGATGNTVSGNFIGTDAAGTADLGNNWDGVYIGDGAQNNTVGGDTPGERNVISGNDQGGVVISDSGATGNTVSGNYIGTDATGAADLGNAVYGVSISGGAQNNTVGGDTPGERNVISGNDGGGVCIKDSGTTGNTVSGNYIGTDASGSAGLGNTGHGVLITFGAQNNTVGGDTPGERNVISGNGASGVRIWASGTTGNVVSGNYIGTDAGGTVDLGNTWDGVDIAAGAQNNTVGGDTPGERNVISGNDQSGVRIYSSSTTGNTVSGNTIGTNASGTADLGNAWDGVAIDNGAQNNTIGPGNVIAYNSRDGVAADGGSTTGNTITQNSIFVNDMGIKLTDGANGGIAAPIIVTATTTGPVNIVGTACTGCTVEVFESGDADGEGETYVGSTTADATGAFTVTVSSLSNIYLTATATDVVSGTSEFSAVSVTETKVYLPLVLKNQ